MDELETIKNSANQSDTTTLTQNHNSESLKSVPSDSTDSNDLNQTRSELLNREMEMKAQDDKLLATLDEVLEKHSARSRTIPSHTEQPVMKQISDTISKSGVGFISLGLILIFLGVMLLYCLLSPNHNFLLLLKLSPICLVLVGLEIIINQIILHGKFKIHVPSILISAVVTISCCIMCAVFNEKFSANTSDYNNRSIAAEIYDLSYKHLKDEASIASLDVNVDINPVGDVNMEGISSLSSDDYVNITVNLSGMINTPKEFAEICKRIMDSYSIMGINVTNFYFSNESTLHTYNLQVEGKFAQDSSCDELEGLVNHIYLRDIDYIEDLEDLVDKS